MDMPADAMPAQLPYGAIALSLGQFFHRPPDGVGALPRPRQLDGQIKRAAGGAAELASAAGERAAR